MPSSSFVFFLVLLFGTLPAWSGAYTVEPDPRIDVQHYRFGLTISDDTDLIQGEADMVIKFTASDVRYFSLNLVGRTDDTGMRVTQVQRDNQAVSYEHVDDLLTIRLTTPPAVNDVRTFRIVYRGIPADGLTIARNKYGDRTFFGDNWPNRARHWLPTHDHPSDKATCEFVVRAPSHYEVIANGTKREESDLPPEQGRNLTLTHWATQHPIATKVMVFGAARFAIRYDPLSDRTDIQDWVFPEDREIGFKNFSSTANVVAFFEEQLGPYPYEKLANVQSSTRYGGMENASNIFYNQDAIENEQTIEPLIAHEVAHQWFGNAVTERSWQDVWLSEGFATYMAHLYMARTYGADTLRARLRADRERIFSFQLKSPQSAVIDTSETNLFKLLNANTYQKGAWFLHMLRNRVGERAFFQALRQYYQQYQHGNASTQDFRKVVERASGKKLRDFFRMWLYQPGYPVVKGTWKYAGLSKKLTLDLEQVQLTEALFPIELPVAIYYEGVSKPDMRTVSFSALRERRVFKLSRKPQRVVLDPRGQLLMESLFTKR